MQKILLLLFVSLFSVSVNAGIGESNFLAYPNPAEDGKLWLKFEKASQAETTVLIYDMTGTVVYESILNLTLIDKHQIDISSFAQGNYFVLVSLNGESLSQRITVK